MNPLYIVSKLQDCIFPLDKFVDIYCSKGSVRVMADGKLPYTLGDYQNDDVARVVLMDIAAHICTGGVYQMPDDERAQVLMRGAYTDHADKFAANGKKPVRRGGS